MPHLALEQENTSSILALYAINDDGILYDPAQVTFHVLDPDGAQVFPDPSGEMDVTTLGRVDKGVFYAFDSGTSAGWASAADADIGTYKIVWTYTDEDDVTPLTWTMKFDITEAGTESPFWTYISPNVVRNEGIDSTALPAIRMMDIIERAQQYIERMCRMPFRPVRDTAKIDGGGSRTLFFSVPLIAVDNLKMNTSDQELDPSEYVVYYGPSNRQDAGWLVKDNRRNPRIALSGATLSPFASQSVFTTARMNGSTFRNVAQGQVVKAVWGFLEPDGTTPKLIERAMLLLILANAELLDIGAQSGLTAQSPIIRERTDLHEIEYARPGAQTVSSSMLATTREVEEILNLYRPPVGIGAPPTTWITLAVGSP